MRVCWQSLPVDVTYYLQDTITLQTLLVDREQIINLILFHVANSHPVDIVRVKYIVRTDRDLYAGYVIEFSGYFKIRAYKKKLKLKSYYKKKRWI